MVMFGKAPTFSSDKKIGSKKISSSTDQTGGTMRQWRSVLSNHWRLSPGSSLTGRKGFMTRRLFQHTELEHTPRKTFYQPAIMGFLFIVGERGIAWGVV